MEKLEMKRRKEEKLRELEEKSTSRLRDNIEWLGMSVN